MKRSTHKLKYACWVLNKAGMSTRNIAEIMGVHHTTVVRHAKKGKRYINEFLGNKRKIQEVSYDPVVLDQFTAPIN